MYIPYHCALSFVVWHVQEEIRGMFDYRNSVFPVYDYGNLSIRIQGCQYRNTGNLYTNTGMLIYEYGNANIGIQEICVLIRECLYTNTGMLVYEYGNVSIRIREC